MSRIRTKDKYQEKSMSDWPYDVDAKVKGGEIYKLLERLFPICRSITGNGVRQSLNI